MKSPGHGGGGEAIREDSTEKEVKLGLEGIRGFHKRRITFSLEVTAPTKV